MPQWKTTRSCFLSSPLFPIPLARNKRPLILRRDRQRSAFDSEVESLLRRCSDPLKCDAHAFSGIHRLPSIYAYAVDTICGLRIRGIRSHGCAHRAAAAAAAAAGT